MNRHDPSLGRDQYDMNRGTWVFLSLAG